jgi:hypothetical protein
MLERAGRGLIDQPHVDLGDIPGGKPQNLYVNQRGPGGFDILRAFHWKPTQSPSLNMTARQTLRPSGTDHTDSLFRVNRRKHGKESLRDRAMSPAPAKCKCVVKPNHRGGGDSVFRGHKVYSSFKDTSFMAKRIVTFHARFESSPEI